MKIMVLAFSLATRVAGESRCVDQLEARTVHVANPFNALHYHPMLLLAATRARLARSKWQQDLDKQPGWRDAFQHTRFSNTYTLANAWLWWGALQDHRENVKDYLEIGSWEGQSSVIAAWMFPNARISCADWFANAEAEAAFDQNTAPFADRLEKLPGTSVDILMKLTAHGRRFDVMYIDGDHQFDAVMMDTILSWPLLRVGGFLIWDDYLWSHPDVPDLTPKSAIDAWLATRKPSTKYMFAGAQVCVQKTASDPILRDMSGKLIAPPAERP